MTPRRRTSSSSSSTTRPDTTTPDTPTRPPGGHGGDGTTVNLDGLDAMTVKLDATGGKVDAVGTTVGNVNVGPQSMGIVGSNFTGAAQNHLKTAQQHVRKAKEAVDNARKGTTATASTYRQRDETNKVNLEKAYDDTTVPNQARPTSTTPSSSTTTPASTKVDAPPPIRQDQSTPTNIQDRLNPTGESTPDPTRPDAGTPRWEPSQRERDLRNRQIVSMTKIGGAGNVNAAYTANLDDGTRGVYKPVSGENTEGMRQDITGDLGRREVAASRVDQMLGFDRVPTTAMVDGPHGPGSLQMFAENSSGSRLAEDYPLVQQHQMAVLDYVTGNTDRHRGNYLTGPDGSVVAIDHGFSFPDGTRDAIRSDFVRDHLDQPLDPSVVAAVRAVDPAAMRHMLQESGLSPTAVDLSIARLEEIQRNGRITGEAWPGRLVDAAWNPVRGSLP